jgi:predicted dehydrogenase
MTGVAIIGTGNISQYHIDSYLAFPEKCKITHLVDLYPEKAEQLNQKNKLNARILTSYKDLLDEKEVDLVSICTPPSMHQEPALALLLAGKHIIVEKPMAMSLEQCDAMIEGAKKSGRILSPVAQNRFREPVVNLRKVLESGKIGRVLHAQIDSSWWRGHSYYDLWWRGAWKTEGGGCTLNHAVHHIDMLGWMLGRPSRVTAVMSNVAHDNAEVEDISIAIMQYDDGLCAPGALVQVTSSLIHHGEEQRLVFQGEKARVSAPWEVYASKTQPNGFPVEDTEYEQEIIAYYNGLSGIEYQAHRGQIHNVLAAIEKGEQALVGGDDGRLTIELITAVYKSASEQKTVLLPIKKDDPFYTLEGRLQKVPCFFEKTGNAKELSGAITVGGNYGKNS